MKKCPFCAEEIQDTAIKCKHCREFLHAPSLPLAGENNIKWYFRKSFVIFAVCSIGPLALPLVWLNPKTTRGWKIGLTIAILVFSWILFRITLESIRNLTEYYKLFNSM